MAFFSTCVNSWARAYQAFSKKPKIMWASTLGGGALGTVVGFGVSGIIYAAVTDPSSCDWGNFVIDHAKEFGCVVTGDPCPQDGTGMVKVKPELQSDAKPALQGEPDLTIKCSDPANVGKLKQAASDFVANESSQNQKSFWSSAAEYIFIAVPILGFVAGAYAGYRKGLKKAEAQMTEDLFQPFLTETDRQEAASSETPPGSPTSVIDAQARELEAPDSQTLQMQPLSPTSRHTSGFLSPTNPRNNTRQGQLQPFEIEVRSVSLSPKGNSSAA
jgi:hypothetical protein